MSSSEVTVVKKIVIVHAPGKTSTCKNRGCFNFVFLKCSDDNIRCNDCGEIRALVEDEQEGQFPRDGMEYWDRFNQIPSYSFRLDRHNSVRRIHEKSGNWKEGYEVGQLIEEAQSEINSLKARLARLEPKAV